MKAVWLRVFRAACVAFLGAFVLCGAVLAVWSASPNVDADRRLGLLERDSQSIHADHATMMGQLNATIRGLADLKEMVEQHHEAQAGYPAFLASMDTKVNWLMAGVGTGIMGGFGWVMSRLRYANRIADELRAHAKRVLEAQEDLREVAAEKQSAVMEGLQHINEKLAGSAQ